MSGFVRFFKKTRGHSTRYRERYRYRYVFFRDQTAVIQSEHKAILEACHAHDSKTLRETIIYHMNQTLHGIRSFVEQNQPKQD